MFSDLTRRNWAAGVVCKDSGDDGLNPGTTAAAPGEIETRAFDEELVLADGNSGVSGGLRIGGGGDGGGVPGTVIGGLLDSEQESNEEEGGEEVKEEEETLSAIPSPSPSSVSAANTEYYVSACEEWVRTEVDLEITELRLGLPRSGGGKKRVFSGDDDDHDRSSSNNNNKKK
nr:hypothetical protein Iba_chr09eCG11040 [Ipomoea batatas]